MSATTTTRPDPVRSDADRSDVPTDPAARRRTGGRRRRLAATLALVLMIAVAWHLWPGDATPMAPYESLAADVRGTYRLDDGGHLTLWGSRTSPLFELDGSVADLVADGTDRYRTSDGTTSLTVTRDAGDTVTGIALQRSGKPEVHAPKEVLHRDLEVSIDSDGATLAGTLLLPTEPGPHPAVVMVHGAAPTRRDQSRLMASHLARRGVATLVYDKRGVGESTGDHAGATFDQLTADALAGVSLLAAQPEVDPSRVGVLGSSQGGWIGAQAATATEDVAFVAALSPSGFSPADQQAWLHGSMLAARGFDRVAMTIADRVDRLAYSSLDLVEAGLMPSIPQVPGFWFHSLDPHLDTADLWAEVRQPVLAVWGDLDCQVPAHDSARKLAAALRRGGNPDVTLTMLPGADHSLTLTGPCAHETGLGHHDSYTYADGVLALAADWIGGQPGTTGVDTPGPTHDSTDGEVLGWHLEPPAAAPWYGTIAAQFVAVLLLLGAFAAIGPSWAAGRLGDVLQRRGSGPRRPATAHLVGVTALAGLVATVVGGLAIVEIAMLGATHATFLVGGPTVAGSSVLLTAARLLNVLTLGLFAASTVDALRRRPAGRRFWLVAAGVGGLALWAAYWQLLPLQ